MEELTGGSAEGLMLENLRDMVQVLRQTQEQVGKVNLNLLKLTEHVLELEKDVLEFRGDVVAGFRTVDATLGTVQGNRDVEDLEDFGPGDRDLEFRYGNPLGKDLREILRLLSHIENELSPGEEYSTGTIKDLLRSLSRSPGAVP